MKNQIQKYSIIPDAEQVRQSEREEFIQEVMKGLVMYRRGYCPLKNLGRTSAHLESDIVNNPIRVLGYSDIPDARGEGRSNPMFKRVNYTTQDGRTSSMVIHIDIVEQNPVVSGLSGLLIPKALLIKTKR